MAEDARHRPTVPTQTHGLYRENHSIYKGIDCERKFQKSSFGFERMFRFAFAEQEFGAFGRTMFSMYCIYIVFRYSSSENESKIDI
jgi:hypothetical protein